MKSLEHGRLLDAKSVMYDGLPELAERKELIPECLQAKYKKKDKLFKAIVEALK